jgi:hypothetical protein
MSQLISKIHPLVIGLPMNGTGPQNQESRWKEEMRTIKNQNKFKWKKSIGKYPEKGGDDNK